MKEKIRYPGALYFSINTIEYSHDYIRIIITISYHLVPIVSISTIYIKFDWWVRRDTDNIQALGINKETNLHIAPSLVSWRHWLAADRYWRSSLQWRHNECYGVSNPQPHDCLLDRLFRHKSKKTSKLRVTGLCGGNSPVTGEFPTQRSSNADNVSIWWRHRAGADTEIFRVNENNAVAADGIHSVEGICNIYELWPYARKTSCAISVLRNDTRIFIVFMLS